MRLVSSWPKAVRELREDFAELERIYGAIKDVELVPGTPVHTAREALGKFVAAHSNTDAPIAFSKDEYEGLDYIIGLYLDNDSDLEARVAAQAVVEKKEAAVAAQKEEAPQEPPPAEDVAPVASDPIPALAEATEIDETPPPTGTVSPTQATETEETPAPSTAPPIVTAQDAEDLSTVSEPAPSPGKEEAEPPKEETFEPFYPTCILDHYRFAGLEEDQWQPFVTEFHDALGEAGATDFYDNWFKVALEGAGQFDYSNYAEAFEEPIWNIVGEADLVDEDTGWPTAETNSSIEAVLDAVVRSSTEELKAVWAATQDAEHAERLASARETARAREKAAQTASALAASQALTRRKRALKLATTDEEVKTAIDLLTTASGYRELVLPGKYTQTEADTIVKEWRSLPKDGTVFSFHSPGGGQFKVKSRGHYTDVNTTICAQVGKFKNVIHISPTDSVATQLLRDR